MRCAILIPAPAMLACSLRSVTSLTGPLWMPMRTGSSGWLRSALAISTAHRTGASKPAKDERAAISGGQPQQLPFRFRGAKLLSATHDLAQLLNARSLLGCPQFGIADDVDEQDVGQLETNSWFLPVDHRWILRPRHELSQTILSLRRGQSRHRRPPQRLHTRTGA